MQSEVFQHAEILIEPELLRHVTDGVTQLARVPGWVQPIHRDDSRTRYEQPGDQPQQSRFAGPIRAYQTSDNTWSDRGRNAFQGQPAAPRKALLNRINNDKRLRHQLMEFGLGDFRRYTMRSLADG